MIFVEAPLTAQQTTHVPSALLDQCATQHIPYTGNAVGRNSTTDLSGVVRGPYPQVLGWRPRGIAALAGCVVTALLGMVTVVWYAMGGQLDETEVRRQVELQIARKRENGGGLLRRGAKAVFGRK